MEIAIEVLRGAVWSVHDDVLLADVLSVVTFLCCSPLHLTRSRYASAALSWTGEGEEPKNNKAGLPVTNPVVTAGNPANFSCRSSVGFPSPNHSGFGKSLRDQNINYLLCTLDDRRFALQGLPGSIFLQSC